MTDITLGTISQTSWHDEAIIGLITTAGIFAVILLVTLLIGLKSENRITAIVFIAALSLFCGGGIALQRGLVKDVSYQSVRQIELQMDNAGLSPAPGAVDSFRDELRAKYGESITQAMTLTDQAGIDRVCNITKDSGSRVGPIRARIVCSSR